MKTMRKVALAATVVAAFGVGASAIAYAGTTGSSRTPDVAAVDPVDAAQDFDAARDVDPSLPAVRDIEDGSLPGVDFVAPEGPAEPEVAAFKAAGITYGGKIKRSVVIARAKNWYSRNVPYSQSAYAWDVNHGKKYRTDCSGFVSMTWALTSSHTTRDLNKYGTAVGWGTLKPGDMLLRAGHHVQLFEKWADSKKTVFWIYEEGSTASDMNHYKVRVASSKANGYKPYKYKKIVD